MLDPATNLEQGGTYTHHLNVASGGTWSPSDIVIALAGDTNFQNVSANIVAPGILTSRIDVSFEYAGDGSTAGANGEEMAAVLNDHFSLSVFSYTGTDGGITTAPPAAPSGLGGNTALWVVGGILLLAILFVVMKTTADVKDITT